VRNYLRVFLAVIFVPLTATLALAQTVSGRVIDASGRTLPRAYVRMIAPGSTSTPAVFTDSEGRFKIETASTSCTIEVSLTGFTTTTVPCAAHPLDVTLDVAPVSEHVVVAATRSAMPAGELGNSVTAFDAATLERRQFPLLADVLLGSPGVAIERTGARGGVTSLYVRGGESNYNKVLLDGIPMNEPGGTFNFNNITSENLERVEIVRGAQSALFGSDAMASVIQLVTARGRPARRWADRSPPKAAPSARDGSPAESAARPGGAITRSARRISRPTTRFRTTTFETPRCPRRRDRS